MAVSENLDSQISGKSGLMGFVVIVLVLVIAGLGGWLIGSKKNVNQEMAVKTQLIQSLQQQAIDCQQLRVHENNMRREMVQKLWASQGDTTRLNAISREYNLGLNFK